MAIIYRINNSDDTDKQVPSKAYVDSIAKQILDVIVEHNNNSSAHDSLIKIKNYSVDTKSCTVEDFPSLVSDEPQEITPEDIKTDANNGFISQATLMSLKEKPTLLEVKQMVNNAKEDVASTMQSRFDEMLNAQDAMEKIKILINAIKEDSTLNSLLQSIADKTDNSIFEEHIKDEMHLTSNDRKALNVLIQLSRLGFADWNATADDINFIQNKPTKLPADGGNADSVGGYTADKLINKSSSDLVIGIDNGRYSPSQVDLLIESDYSNLTEVAEFISNKFCGKIDLRPGYYPFKALTICYDRSVKDYDTIITGAGNNTVIHNCENFIVNQRVKLKEICFESSDVHIGSNCNIEGCEFSDCNIYLEASVSTTITNCYFKDCTFIFIANCTSNIISYNRLLNVQGFKYIGKNNIIANNITL
jgi:hypothetical protein